MELRFPGASRSSHLPFILPSIPDAYFWLVVAWKIIDCQPSKAKELTAAPPNPMAHALHKPMGSSSTMIWWHR
jgi:hypothetical protein